MMHKVTQLINHKLQVQEMERNSLSESLDGPR